MSSGLPQTTHVYMSPFCFHCLSDLVLFLPLLLPPSLQLPSHRPKCISRSRSFTVSHLSLCLLDFRVSPESLPQQATAHCARSWSGAEGRRPCEGFGGWAVKCGRLCRSANLQCSPSLELCIPGAQNLQLFFSESSVPPNITKHIVGSVFCVLVS